MKKIHLLFLPTLLVLLAAGCDRQSPAITKQLAELERQAAAAVERQQELEQEIADQKLAAERDAIERERMQIEQDRIDLEREQGEIAAAEAEKLQLRETELARREGTLEQLQATLEEQQAEVSQQAEELSEKDRELAGREAIAFEEDEVQSAPVADYGTFHESLSPYGSWFETEDYGYVWQPAVIRDTTWRPYTRGRWACTDRGWTWISDEPFGWATYHYGRWSLLSGRGWIWIPGSEWAPSWVSWRYCDSYVGWAPLPPETLAYRGSRWGSTVDVTFGIGAGWFNFVQVRNFCNPVRYHCLPYTNNSLYYDQCANVTNIYVQNNRVICGGPRYRELCDRIGRQVPFYRLEVDRHGRHGRDSLGMRPRIQGNRLSVAAPSMDVAWNDGLRPKRVQGRIDDLTVDRKQPLKPEITDRFRQSREQGRSSANQSIAERRTRQLETNRKPTKTASTGQVQRQPEVPRTQVDELHVPAPKTENSLAGTKPQTETRTNITRDTQTPNPLPKGISTIADARKQQAVISQPSGERKTAPVWTKTSTPRIHPPKTSLSGKTTSTTLKPAALTRQTPQQSTPHVTPPANRSTPRLQQPSTQRQQTQVRPPQPQYTPRPQAQPAPRQQPQPAQQFQPAPQRQQSIQRPQPQPQPRQQQSGQSSQRSQGSQQGQSFQRGQRGR